MEVSTSFQPKAAAPTSDDLLKLTAAFPGNQFTAKKARTLSRIAAMTHPASTESPQSINANACVHCHKSGWEFWQAIPVFATTMLALVLANIDPSRCESVL